jgi:hypothetical protein
MKKFKIHLQSDMVIMSKWDIVLVMKRVKTNSLKQNTDIYTGLISFQKENTLFNIV